MSDGMGEALLGIPRLPLPSRPPVKSSPARPRAGPPRDYERAIGPETGLLLKAHTSNYRIVGFTRAPTTAEHVEIGRCRGVPVFEDLGSGSLVDLTRYGLTREPTVPEVVKSGVDLVSFSTDKLLGGPQGGVLAGAARTIKALKANHMLHALRIDKVTMGMLDAGEDPPDLPGADPTQKLETIGAMAPAKLRKGHFRPQTSSSSC